MKPTVSVTNPEKRIEIEGQEFANLILAQAMHVNNLQCLVRAINAVTREAPDEFLEAMQTSLQGLVNASSGVLLAHVDAATRQGLVFQINDGGMSGVTTH